MYAAIRALPPGQHATITRGWRADRSALLLARRDVCATRRRARAADPPDERRRSSSREAVRESVRYHLVADVPLGAFLSAGKDSTTIVALACESGRTATSTDDHASASQEYRGTRAGRGAARGARARAPLRLAATSSATVTRDEFLAELPRILEAMDQPTIDGLELVLRLARRRGELGMKVHALRHRRRRAVRRLLDVPRDPAVRAERCASRRASPAWRAASAASTTRWRRAAERQSEDRDRSLRYCSDYAGAYLMKRGLFMPEELPGDPPATSSSTKG